MVQQGTETETQARSTTTMAEILHATGRGMMGYEVEVQLIWFFVHFIQNWSDVNSIALLLLEMRQPCLHHDHTLKISNALDRTLGR